MKLIFIPGDIKTFDRKITEEDFAVFNEEIAHPVYSTFAIARDAECCCRLFSEDMKEPDEEGIGIYVSVRHFAPAVKGLTVKFTATLIDISGNKITCNFRAEANGVIIAEGTQEQKIVKREKLKELFGNGPK